MSLFRKQPQTAPITPPEERGPALVPMPTPAHAPPLFKGPIVDLHAIYQLSKVSAEDLDRVTRAEDLLHSLPTMAPQTREVVDVTFRAFGVDRTKILSAASLQLDALEAFIRVSHEQTQRVIDTSAQRIAELQGEIERCRHESEQATREGEERARSVNNVLLKVQRVLEFFGDEQPRAAHSAIDEDTMLNTAGDDAKPKASKPPPSPAEKGIQRTSIP